MSSMVERVARAIHDKDYEGIPNEEWEGQRELRIEMARAAIEAMRDPTEAMVKAGSSQFCTAIEAEIIFQEMIDAALSEPPADDYRN